ncbi:MAG: hypothetical protein AAF467_24605 [Actinomycetota bacterium]
MTEPTQSMPTLADLVGARRATALVGVWIVATATGVGAAVTATAGVIDPGITAPILTGSLLAGLAASAVALRALAARMHPIDHG